MTQLTQCPCGKQQVASNAEKCPHCGGWTTHGKVYDFTQTALWFTVIGIIVWVLWSASSG